MNISVKKLGDKNKKLVLKDFFLTCVLKKEEYSVLTISFYTSCLVVREIILLF